MNSITDYSVVSLLPDSLKQDPFIVALAEAVEIELKEAYREAETLSNLNDVDNLPEPLLDYLAYQKHVDFYDNMLPIDKKRNLVKNATMWHRKKGTKSAVESIVSVIFPNSKVIEWFEYAGNPYYFSAQLDLEEPFNSPDDKLQLKNIIDATKNRRSWLDKIIFKGYAPINQQIINEIASRIKMQTHSNPWAFAGYGTGDGVEIIQLDGKYKLDGNTFLNSFIKTDGPAYGTDSRIKMKIDHDFGVHEISIAPILDGEYNLDGEILLQFEEQTVRLAVKQDAMLRYKKREIINVAPMQQTPVLCTVKAVSGVHTLNGAYNLDGNISLNQTLFEHSGLFRVKKSGVTVEEVAI